MIGQLLLFLSFLLTGTVLQFCFKKRAPLWFLLPGAFFWGALNWALLTLISILVLQRFSLALALLTNTIEVLAALVVIFRAKEIMLLKREWSALLGYYGFFLAAALTFSFINVSRVSPDSLYLLKMAGQMAANGFTGLTWTSPAAYGYFVSLVQAAAGSLGLDYLYTFQPLLSMNFVALIFLAIQHFLSGHLLRWQRVLFGLFSVTFLFSSTMMRFQFGYIHTNLPSAAFLFISLVALIQLARSKEDCWLVQAMVGFTGFAITRTENPLLLLLFLGLFLPILGTTYRQRLGVIMPALAAVLLLQLITLGIDTSLVNAEMSTQLPTLIVAGMGFVYLLFMLFIVASRVRWIEEKVILNFHKILVTAVLAAFILALIINPVNILTSIRSIFSATMLSGGWDAVWLTVLTLLIFIVLYFAKELTKPPLVFLGLALLCYYLAILLMSLYRAPYHPQWNDSANRMFTQLLPLVILWLTLLLEQITPKSSTGKLSEPYSVIAGTNT